MKRLLMGAAALLVANVASAKVIYIATRPIEMGGGASWLMFGYDELGGSWIEERDDNGYPDGDRVSFPRFVLPGLHFDPMSRQILFGRLVCANVYPIAGGYGVFNTERCRLRSYIRQYGVVGPRMETIVMEVR